MNLVVLAAAPFCVGPGQKRRQGLSSRECMVWMVVVALLVFAAVAQAAPQCVIRPDTQIVYSKADGVGGASIVWVEDLLWWLKSHDPSVTYQGLEDADVQYCDLASMTNLRIYLNPGGNAYNQLSGLGANGTANIKAFIERDQTKVPSVFAGFCAGAYLVSYAYVWETMYEGPGYCEQSISPCRTPPLPSTTPAPCCRCDPSGGSARCH